MTNEEAVKYTEQCIDRMKDCIDRHQKKGFPVGEMQETMEYYECVLAALKCEKKPIGESLTLEKLREMGGKPYWHVGLQTDSPDPHWKILDPFVARCPEDYGYGKRWLAYAYPPAHIDREAWEPCEWCVSCKNCKYDCDYDSDEALTGPCSDCGRGLNYSPVGFCQKCGRPLTEEAWAELEKRLRG